MDTFCSTESSGGRGYRTNRASLVSVATGFDAIAGLILAAPGA
jgi:hypothetical protein